MEFNIIPKINGKIEYLSGVSNIKELGFLIDIDNIKSFPLIFLQRISDLGYKGQLSNRFNANVRLLSNIALLPSIYQIDIKYNNIDIYASDNNGFNNGLISLYNIIMATPREQRLPNIHFKDKPKYDYRGLMIDTARNFVSVDEMKRIIEEASILKINALHWHLTDDQGFRIESKIYPQLNEIGSMLNGEAKFYTQKEYVEIIKYALDRGVEIIPEIGLIGHMGAAIASIPELTCGGKNIQIVKGPFVNDNLLCIGNKKATDITMNILDEIISLYPIKKISIGGDEISKSNWEKCPYCQAKLKEEGLNNFDELIALFFNNIYKYVNKNYGIDVVCWADISQASNLSNDIILHHWYTFNKNNELLKRVHNNQRIIMSDNFRTYFDYPYAFTSLRSVYNYKPNIKGTLINTTNLLGIEANLWTETVYDKEKLEELLFPRLHAFAENSWSDILDYNDFKKRLENVYIEELKKKGINYTSIDNATKKRILSLGEMISFISLKNRMMRENEKKTQQKSASIFSVKDAIGLVTGFIDNDHDESKKGYLK